MPSKHRKKLVKKKTDYTANSRVTKQKAKAYYIQNAETIKQRSKSRATTDETWRKKNHIAKKRKLQNETYAQEYRKRALINTKQRLLLDEQYRERNREQALINTKRRLLLDEQYKQRNRHQAVVNKKQRLLLDEEYRERHRQQALVNTKQRLLLDEQYKQKNRERASINQTLRLNEDEQYREKNRQRACISKKRRLEENIECREQHRQRERQYKRRKLENNLHKHKDKEAAKIAMKKRWDTDNKYREKQREACKVRKLRKKPMKTYQTKYPSQKQAAANKLVLSSRQRYWKRRGRLMASSKLRANEFLLQQKMSRQSNVPAFDVGMLFKTASHTEHTSMKTLRYQHTKLAEAVTEALSYTTDHQCSTEEDIEAAFSPRKHTAYSEPYFWEWCYRVLSTNEVVPIDTNGQARLFLIAQQTKKVHQENNCDKNLPTSAVVSAGTSCDVVSNHGSRDVTDAAWTSSPDPASTSISGDCHLSTEVRSGITSVAPVGSELHRLSAVHSPGVSCGEVQIHNGSDASDTLMSRHSPASTFTAEDCEQSTTDQVSLLAPGGSECRQLSTAIPSTSDSVPVLPAEHDAAATSISESVRSGQSACPIATTASNSSITEISTQWYCNTSLCTINEESVLAVNDMLKQIATKDSKQCLHLYLNLNNCTNTQKNPFKLGHSLSCTQQNGCNSLLKHARLVACHFSGLRSVIQRVYNLRRLSLCIRTVQQARHSGDVNFLREAIQALVKARDAATNDKEHKTNKEVSSDQQPAIGTVNEAEVVAKFGKQLRQVANDRDTYVTTACDLCEQLKPNLKTLKSLQNRKGFDSEKMANAIDILYQHKTQHEDIEDFLNNIHICSYCMQKLLGNKEVSRSVFNKLAVVTTPDCIKTLNIFEKNLIKFCMTCLTVIRLGQITNKKRPSNELTSALKGRIAYIPVDVEANAKFTPDNLFDVNSLSILVAGQPTKSQKVWTSVVDLAKVHAALLWLKENNRLYTDIPTYTVEDLQNIITAKMHNTETSEHSLDNGILKKLDDAAKSYLYENFTIQPLSSDYPADIIADYQLDKTNAPSSSIYDNDLDLKAFPELYPTAENGMRDARTISLAPSDFIKSRLLNLNSKFRLNMNYLFHLFQQHEVNAMCHSVGHMLRTVTGGSLTAKAFCERLKNKDGEVTGKLFSVMANVRGSREYFAKMAMDVKWMIRRLGPPTLFVTCSMAEWFSEPFIQYLKQVNHDVPNVDSMTPAELCAMDPVNVSIHFQKKWTAIFNKLINSKDGVFGEVTDFFYRIEYQARGAGHTHTLLWIKDAPVIGKNTEDEVKTYIEKIATCEMPDPETSPTLHELVSRFQVHHCNSYCTNVYKHNSKFYKKCRFGFPRPEKTQMELHDVAECLAVNKTQPRKRLYHLPRTSQCSNVNDYNPALLMANQANVDIQYIAHLGSRLPYYITDYVTKHERSEQDEMWQEIFTSTKSLASNALSFMLRSVKNRQVGGVEAADRLLGHKLFSKSRQLRFADLQKPDKVKRVLKPIQELQHIVESNPDSEDIYAVHWVLDVYPNRPDILENTSLYEVMSWYEKEKTTKKSNPELELKNLPYTLRKRKYKPYIITHPVLNPHSSSENQELYAYYMLKLFRPWRSEDDICEIGRTCHETFVLLKEQLTEMTAYHDSNIHISHEEEALEAAIKRKADNDQSGNAEDAPEAAFEGCVTDNLSSAMAELLTNSKQTAQHRQDMLQEDYETLNADQRRVVDKVTDAVSNNTAIHLIVSGQGGTGKTRVIDVIHRLLSTSHSTALPVVVAAPTGLAAFNVGGTTLHRMLSLPVEHGKPSDYKPLNADQLTIIRATLKGLQLLIVDEISMVSSLTLLFVHLRLTEIMTNNNLFGGISTVFFGDLFQLPPVKGNQPFIPVTFLEAKQRVGAVGSVDIWAEMTYDELTVNVRQKGDKKYAELLSDVRTGRLSHDQQALLVTRLITSDHRPSADEICDRYDQLVLDGEDPVVLLPRSAACTQLNDNMLRRIGVEIQPLPATDTQDTIVIKNQQAKVTNAYEKVADDVTRTAGLERNLNLCIGAKVMLKRNKAVEAGLVNGAVGTVVGFEANHSGIQQVVVKFLWIDKPIPIVRESCTFEVLKNVFYTRKQFPLMLAFALTIHKAQGLSVKTAIVDAGSTCFGSGMIYVALSRVTTLNGLHLIELDKSKIVCDKKAVTEYNRLRQHYAPHLGNIITSQSTVSSTDQPESRSSSSDVDHTAQHNSHDSTRTADGQLAIRTFDCCEITSLDEESQSTTCTRLNLQLFPLENITMSRSNSIIAKKLQQLIYTNTNTDMDIKIKNISGDGNCLFRALSYAVCRCQSLHEILRQYVVNHMKDPVIEHSLQQLFAGERPEETHNSHLVRMQESGCWGTEQEIATAAHVLQCSIICCSKYNGNNQYCLQHFPPHFLEGEECTNRCRHKTIYLVNSSGVHYDTAVVTHKNTSPVEE